MPHDIKQAAKDYSIKTYGVPKDWTLIPDTLEHSFHLSIESAYIEGYNSRNVEVSNLRGQIKYLEEDKHPKEIKELKDTLHQVRVKLLDAFGIFGGGQKVNEVFDIINKSLKQ